ncbi:chemotaxis protein CheW [Rhodobacteraceae bacterium XHP0102]|nr:chemotaxis protein CheW [Rhodobacteraceae bacterium XHP0102]
MLDSTDHTTSDLRHDMVAFRVADQDFCIDIGMVREIRSWSETTFLPHAQPYVKGVINLRGAVVAVIDLAARLGLGVTKTDPRNVIIIAQVGSQTVGLLADHVSDILPVPPEAIKPMPDVAAEEAKAFITGLVSMDDDRLLRKLDLARILPDTKTLAK